jgi:mono/diheme cytochrome c family protein
MCIYCHTPKDERGQLIQSQLLTGAPMPIKSPWPAQEWAIEAPKIAGLPSGYEEKDVVRLLMEGRKRDGDEPKRPMPPFRMNRRDASDVAAYLASLKPPASMP